MAEYVAFDLETTGFRPGVDHIIQIGAVRFDETGRILGRFETFVNPHCPIPQAVSDLCHITDADVAGGLEERDAVFRLAAFCKGAELVGHSGHFDRSFCAVFAPLAFRKERVLYDTYWIASAFIPKADKHSLIALAQRFGVRHDQPHRAPSDAEATALLFATFIEMAKNAPQAEFDAYVAGARSTTQRFFTTVVAPLRNRTPRLRRAVPRSWGGTGLRRLRGTPMPWQPSTPGAPTIALGGSRGLGAG